MLLRAVQPRLCHTCRSDLLHLFDAGLGSTAASRVPQRQIRSSRFPRPSYRHKNPPISTSGARIGGSEASASQTVQEPEVAKNGSEIAQEPDDAEDGAEAFNPVEAIRDADGSVEDIVREARTLHGEYLPQGVLSEHEFKTYRSLYGDPAEPFDSGESLIQDEDQLQLLDRDGETVTYHETKQYGPKRESQDEVTAETELDDADEMERRAIEAAEQVQGELRIDSGIPVPEEDPPERSHPLTVAGRFHTSPSTTFLPQDSFVRPIQQILSEFSNKHIKEMSERLFGGGGLPDSALTPRIGRVLPQKPIPLGASQHTMGQMEANSYVSVIWPSTYAAVSSILTETRKRLGSPWLRGLLAKEGGPSVLDAGGGGVAILAWRDIIKAEWEALHSSDSSPPPPPFGKSTALTGADGLRHRAASLLEDTTFLPRLPDYIHVRDGTTLSDDRPAPHRKQYDVILAPHTLWSLGEEWQRKQQVQNLWSLLNPDGGVLVILEKGVPRGFEVVAGARKLLLDRYIATADSPTYESQLESSNEEGAVPKGKGVIIAPCTNHAPCPMYPVPGISRGRKNYCSFQQRYIRPPFLQRILGARDRNHDDVDFSYVAVQKGRDLQDLSATQQHHHPIIQGKSATDAAFAGHENSISPDQVATVNPLALPRLILPALKRPGHVTMDVCTPSGQIERWTVTKSFSRAAYRDARKSSWGDLWALGAKTTVPRNLQLGGEHSKKVKRQEKLQDKAHRIHERMLEDRQVGREVEEEMNQAEEEDELALGLDADLGDGGDVDIDPGAAQVLRLIRTEEEMKRRRLGKARDATVATSKSATPATTAAADNDDSQKAPSDPHRIVAAAAAQLETQPSISSSSSSSSSSTAPEQPTESPLHQKPTPSPPNTNINTQPLDQNPDQNPDRNPEESTLLVNLFLESRADARHARANSRLRGNAASILQRGSQDGGASSRDGGGEEGGEEVLTEKKKKTRMRRMRMKMRRREWMKGGGG